MNGMGPKKSAGMTRKMVAKEKVFELRCAGVPFQRIADECGISKTYAIKLFYEGLDERKYRIEGMVDKHVSQQVAQYDRLIMAHWPDRRQPAHAAIILKALADKAKVLGLHAPVKVEHGGLITTSEESQDERAQRLIKDAVEEIGQMTPEQLAAEVASLG